MATISENLQIIKDSTDAIKQAIIAKGSSIDGDISTWANAINNISGGNSTEAEYIFTGTVSKNGSYLNINGTLNKSPYPDFTTGVCNIVVILLSDTAQAVVGHAFASPDDNAVYNISINIGTELELPKNIPMFLLNYFNVAQVKFVQQT